MDIPFLISLLMWGLFVGVVFASIGAAGGILTSFGLISLFGLKDPNMVKPMTQIVVLGSALVFVPGYFKRKAVVWPLGVLLGVGGLAGAWLGSSLSSSYLSDMRSFRPWFGALTLLVAAKIAFDFFHRTQLPAARQDQDVFHGVRYLHFKLSGLQFDYSVHHYDIPLWQPLLAGFVIALVAAIFGVGGGFLLVPFMMSVLRMPMHIIPATAAIAIFMSLVISIGNYMRLGADLDWRLLLPLILGAMIGAVFGHRLNRNMKHSWLKAALGVIVLGIGLKYILA